MVVKPDLIMASSCLFGQTGPLSGLAGYGTMGASLSGFYDMTGWPDREPAGVFGAYTDYISPRLTACVILAAVDHHRRTGQGQHLDYSQMEAATHFLAPALVARQATVHKRTRRGNADDHMVPHGVYPCLGDDRWIAIACADDTQWARLAAAIGLEDRKSVV